MKPVKIRVIFNSGCFRDTTEGKTYEGQLLEEGDIDDETGEVVLAEELPCVVFRDDVGDRVLSTGCISGDCYEFVD